MSMHDDIAKVLFSEEELSAIVSRLGDEISRDYAGKELLMVSVLKGSVMIMADLMRKVRIPASIDFMSVSAYGNGVKHTGNVQIIKDLGQDIRGKNVLIVEDILDSGLTLDYLKHNLESRGPASIRICTLFDKPERRVSAIKADYVGARVPDEFIVGYGLDYAEKYRNLPYVGVLKPEIYTN